MRFESAVTYPADLPTTLAMLLDPAYLDFRIAELGMPVEEKEVSTDDGVTRIMVAATIPSQLIPANYRRFAPAKLRMRLTEVWQPAAGDRSPTGTVTIEFRGLPARGEAGFRLDADGATTVRRYVGEVTVSIPLVGARLEGTAVGALDQVVAAERAAAAKWLARQG